MTDPQIKPQRVKYRSGPVKLRQTMKEGRAYTVKQLVRLTGMSDNTVRSSLVRMGAKQVPNSYPAHWYIGNETPRAVYTPEEASSGVVDVLPYDHDKYESITVPLVHGTWLELDNKVSNLDHYSFSSRTREQNIDLLTARAAYLASMAALLIEIGDRADWREVARGKQ